MASYSKLLGTYEPAAAAAELEPHVLLELAVLKCLLSELPNDIPYETISLVLSNGKIRIIIVSSTVTKAQAAKNAVENACGECYLMNMLTLDRVVAIRKAP